MNEGVHEQSHKQINASIFTDAKIYTLALGNVKIDCLRHEDKLSDISASEITYRWTREDDSPMPLYRIKDIYNETLTIQYALENDSGNYTCAATFKDRDNGNEITRYYTHDLEVGILPEYLLRGTIHFQLMDHCYYIDMNIISTVLSVQMKKRLCGLSNLCHVFIIQGACQDIKESWPMVSFKFIIKTTNILNRLYNIQQSRCGLNCKKAIQLKMLILLSDNLDKFLNLQDFYSSSYEYMVGCRGGFYLADGFCITCRAGTFSREGDTVCTTCVDGHYQPNRGSTECIPCPYPFAAANCLTHFTLAYRTSFLIIFGVCLLLLLFISYLCMKRKPVAQDNSKLEV